MIEEVEEESRKTAVMPQVTICLFPGLKDPSLYGVPYLARDMRARCQEVNQLQDKLNVLGWVLPGYEIVFVCLSVRQNFLFLAVHTFPYRMRTAPT